MSKESDILAELKEQLREALDANQALKEARGFTLGKQPIDEVRGFVPQREPKVSITLNGTKRVDF